MAEYHFAYGNNQVSRVYQIGEHRIALQQGYRLITSLHFIDKNGQPINVPTGFSFLCGTERQQPQEGITFLLTWASEDYQLLFDNQPVLTLKNEHIITLSGNGIIPSSIVPEKLWHK